VDVGFRVSVAARLLGVSRDTLLRLERDGILPPPKRSRGSRGWRVYAPEEMPRLRALIEARHGLVAIR